MPPTVDTMTSPDVQSTQRKLRKTSENENSPNPSKIPVGKSKELFSLYLRASNWIKNRDTADQKIKQLNSRIKKVRHPRQKSVDYCFIDFDTADERDEAYKELVNDETIFVKHIIKDNPELLQKRIEKVQAKREAKKELKNIMKTIAKNETVTTNEKKKKTNQIVIKNLPKETTKAELNEQFSDVIDIVIKFRNGKDKHGEATLTLATPRKAYENSKKSIELHGTQLKIFLQADKTTRNKKKILEKRKLKVKADTTTAKNTNDQQKVKGVGQKRKLSIVAATKDTNEVPKAKQKKKKKQVKKQQ